MDKLIYSDHTPTSVVILVNPNISLHQLRSCSDGVFNDDHWDINKRKLSSLVFSKINWVNAIHCLEEQSRYMINCLKNSNLNNDQLNSLISSTIYDSCKRNYQKHDDTIKSMMTKLLPQPLCYTVILEILKPLLK